MTPTEQDNELREAILLEFKNVHRLAPADYTENCTNIVMQLITADRRRVELEARINELTKLRRMFERLAEYAGDKEWVMFEYDDRIAELKAQQEEVNE